jgi:hypothetical protein
MQQIDLRGWTLDRNLSRSNSISQCQSDELSERIDASGNGCARKSTERPCAVLQGEDWNFARTPATCTRADSQSQRLESSSNLLDKRRHGGCGCPACARFVQPVDCYSQHRNRRLKIS